MRQRRRKGDSPLPFRPPTTHLSLHLFFLSKPLKLITLNPGHFFSNAIFHHYPRSCCSLLPLRRCCSPTRSGKRYVQAPAPSSSSALPLFRLLLLKLNICSSFFPSPLLALYQLSSKATSTSLDPSLSLDRTNPRSSSLPPRPLLPKPLLMPREIQLQSRMFFSATLTFPYFSLSSKELTSFSFLLPALLLSQLRP